jgi:hypothetical protein
MAAELTGSAVVSVSLVEASGVAAASTAAFLRK